MGRALKVEKETLSDRVIKFITTRDDKDFVALSVSSLAQKFKMDRFKLSRTFKAEKNMTLEFCLMQEKMLRCAFILMLNRDITVKEVSKLMGFCTCDYFIQVFKKYFGLVPGRYKEYKTRRGGMKDRRVGEPDRRKNPDGLIPAAGDRRSDLKDRRVGPKDRRGASNFFEK